MSFWDKLKRGYKKLVNSGNRAGRTQQRKRAKTSTPASSSSKPKSTGTSSHRGGSNASSNRRTSSSTTTQRQQRQTSRTTTSRPSAARTGSVGAAAKGSVRNAPRTGAVKPTQKNDNQKKDKPKNRTQRFNGTGSRSGAIGSTGNGTGAIRREGSKRAQETQKKINNAVGSGLKAAGKLYAVDKTRLAAQATEQASKKTGVRAKDRYRTTGGQRVKTRDFKESERIRKTAESMRETATSLEKSAQKDIKKGSRDIKSNLGKKAYEVGVTVAPDLVDYAIPYGATAKGSLRAAESALNLGKAAKAGKVLTKTGKNGKKTLTNEGRQLVKDAMKEVASGKKTKEDAIKDIQRAISKSDLKQNIKKEMLANAMQDATIGTAIDYEKGKYRYQYEGKDMAKHMAESAAMNAAIGAPIAAIAGRTGKAGKKALANEAAEIINKGNKKASALTREEGKELVNLYAMKDSPSLGGLSESEKARYNELISKAQKGETDVATVNANGNLISNPSDSFETALSKDETLEYFKLKAAESVRGLSTNESKRLSSLTNKVEFAKVTNEARLKINVDSARMNISKASASDVSKVRASLDYYEKMGMQSEARKAREVLIKAEKNFHNTVDNVTKAAAKISNDLGRDFKIESADEIAESFAKTGGTVDDPSLIHGFAEFDKDGNIVAYHVNKDSEQAMEFTFGHELTHGFESLGSQYDDFKTALKTFVGDDEWNEMLSSVERQYGNVANANYENEAVANLVGKHLFAGDDRFMKHLLNEQPTLFQKVYEFIRKLLKGTSEHDAQLEALSKQMDDMFNSLSDRNKSIVLGSPETTELLFGGGRTLRDIIDSGVNTKVAQELQDNLQMAKESLRYAIKHSKGDYKELAKARKDIFKDTGWFEGYDGKWRYEIDDSRMKYSLGKTIKTSDANGRYLVFMDKNSGKITVASEDKVQAASERLSELTSKKKLTKKESNELQGLRTQMNLYLAMTSENGVPLGRILQHEKFFELYPDAKDIKFKIRADGEWSDVKPQKNTGEKEAFNYGGYDDRKNELILNAHMFSKDSNAFKRMEAAGIDPSLKIREITAHEMQHYVQGVEGFSKGGDPADFTFSKYGYEKDAAATNQYPKNYELNADELGRINDEKDDIGFDIEDVAGQEEMDDFLSKYWPLMHDISDEELNLLGKEGFVNNVYDELTRANDPITIISLEHERLIKNYLAKDYDAAMLAERNPQKIYKQLAGEVEATDVGERVNMSRSERKRTFPIKEGINVRYAEHATSKYDIDRTLPKRKTNNPTGETRLSRSELSYDKLSDDESAYYENLASRITEEEGEYADPRLLKEIKEDSGNLNAESPAERERKINEAVRQIKENQNEHAASSEQKHPSVKVNKKMRQSERDASMEGRREYDAKAEEKVLKWMDEQEKTPQWERDFNDEKLFALEGTKEMTNYKRQRTRLINQGQWDQEHAEDLYKRITSKEATTEPSGQARPKEPPDNEGSRYLDDTESQVQKNLEKESAEERPKPDVDEDDWEPTKEMKQAERDAAMEGSRYLDDTEAKVQKKLEKESKAKQEETPLPKGEEKPKKPETPAEEKKSDAPTIAEVAENARSGYISAKEMGDHAKKLGETWSSEVEELDRAFKQAAKSGEFGGKLKRKESYDEAFKAAVADVDEDFDKVWNRVMNRDDFAPETPKSAAEKHALLRRLTERAGTGDENAALLHLKLIDKMDSGASLSGHMLQLQSYVLRNSPEGRLRFMMRQVKRMNKEYEKALNGKELSLTEQQVRDILNATDPLDAAKVAEQIGKDLWKQVPAGLIESLNQIRHWSMLFNPKTHGRNVGGNTIFAGARQLSDALEVTATKMAKKTAKGKRLLGDSNMSNFVSGKEQKACKDVLDKRFELDYQMNEQRADRFAEGKRTAGYLNEQTGNAVKDTLAKGMNKLIDANYSLLDKEDRWFFRPAYRKEYIRYCKSKGFTGNVNGRNVVTEKSLNAMTDAQQKAATEWAMQRAKIATFRDDSAISDRLIKWKQATEAKGKTPVGKAGYRALNLGMESVLPFVKTPVNIMRRGMDYSPIGLFRGVADAVAAKDAESFMQGIHFMSTGLTGTGVAALGWWAASHDWVTVEAGDVSGDAFYDRDMGYQDYSLKVHVLGNDYSASLDWMAPMQFAFFQGASVYNEKSEGKGWDTEKFMKVLEASVNPMLEMSFMSSAKDTVESFFQRAYRDDSGSEASWAEAAGRTLLGSLPQGWLGSFVPQMVSQTAGFTDDKFRDTSSTREDELAKSWEAWGRQMKNKIPGLRESLNPKLNRKGEDVTNVGHNTLTKFVNAFANPSNIKKINLDKYDQEIIDIYSEMDDDDQSKRFFLLNFTGNPSYDLKGENLGKGQNDRRMTYEERYDYMRKKRKTQWDSVKKMVDAKSYKDMTNKMKADEIKDYHYISTVKADRAVYKSGYAMRKLTNGNETQTEIWKKVKTYGGNAKDYVDSYIAVESLQARSHASISDYHMKALAIEAMTGKNAKQKDVLEKAYGVWGDKVEPAKKFLKAVGNAKKALTEFSDAFCSGAGYCDSNEVTTSKRNMSLGLAHVSYEVKERTYRAMGHDWQSAQAGGGLKKYGYSYEALAKMETEAMVNFDEDHNNSLKKDEVIAYIDSLGIDSEDEKACLFQYLNNNASKNPYAIIADHLNWGTEPDADLGGRGGWGRRGYRRRGRGGWGRGGGGGGGSGSGAGGTPPATASGAIKGTITDPFGKTTNGSKKSNLDDAYRKKARKLMESTRKKLS